MRNFSSYQNVRGLVGECAFGSILLLSINSPAASLTGPNPLGVEPGGNTNGNIVWQNGALQQQWFWFRRDAGAYGTSTYARSTSAQEQAAGFKLDSFNEAKSSQNPANGFKWFTSEGGQFVQQWFWYRIAAPDSFTPGHDERSTKAASTTQTVPLHFYQYSDSGVGGTETTPSVSSSPTPSVTVPPHGLPTGQHFFPDSGTYSSSVNFDSNPAFVFRSGTVPIAKHKPAALFDAPTEEVAPKLSISVRPNSTFYLEATGPGKLQSTTFLDGPNTIWQDEGPISNSLTITPLPSQPAIFYRLLPPE